MSGLDSRFMRFMQRLPVALLLLVAASALAGANIAVSGAWIRLLPGNGPLAGYVTLHNNGKNALKLVGAKSPAFKRIELHKSMTMNGMDKMQPVQSVNIPANGSFAFSPGGFHLMMWRKHKLKIGEHVPVTLIFANGNELETRFDIEGPEH
jgi:copper(I)-binding protein